MRTIWKFELELAVSQQIDMPMGAKIIHAGLQQTSGVHEAICLWAEVDLGNEPTSRTIDIVGTGHEFRGGEHVGTVQKGGHVWHVYDLGEVEK